MKTMLRIVSSSIVVAAVIAAAAFHGCGTEGTNKSKIDIVVQGLSGTLVLKVQGEQRTIAADGSYPFTVDVRTTPTYLVEIETQPSDATCTLANASGSSAAPNRVVSVQCVAGSGSGTGTGTDSDPDTGTGTGSGSGSGNGVTVNTKPLFFGAVISSAGVHSPAYYLDGKWTVLDAEAMSAGTVLWLDDDIYVFGKAPNVPGKETCLWKNSDKTCYTLDLDTGPSGAPTLHKGSFYATVGQLISDTTKCTYFKDGALKYLSNDAGSTCSVFSIGFSGDDFYASGVLDSKPVYWKNDAAPVTLSQPDPTKYGAANNMFFIDGVMHIYGKTFVNDSDGNQQGIVGKWVDGTWSTFSVPGKYKTFNAFGTVMAGNRAFTWGAAGVASGAANTPVVWEGETMHELTFPSGVTSCNVQGGAINETTSIAIGFCGSNPTQRGYWESTDGYAKFNVIATPDGYESMYLLSAVFQQLSAP